jgi:hypothetical protein
VKQGAILWTRGVRSVGEKKKKKKKGRFCASFKEFLLNSWENFFLAWYSRGYCEFLEWPPVAYYEFPVNEEG